MADEKACQVFHAHTWKKDLCVNCMKSQSAHPKPQAPVPAQRTPADSRETTPDNQGIPVGKIPPTPGDKPTTTEPPSADSKANLEDEINCNKQFPDSTGTRNVMETPSELSRNKGTPESGGDTRANVNLNKPAIASKPRPTATKPKPVIEKSPAKSAASDTDKTSTSGVKDNGAEKLSKTEVDDGKIIAADNLTNVVVDSGIKPKGRQRSGSRPQAPPPKAPQDNAVPPKTSQIKSPQAKPQSTRVAPLKTSVVKTYSKGPITQSKRKDDTSESKALNAKCIKPATVKIKGMTDGSGEKGSEDKKVVLDDEAEYSQVAPSEDGPEAPPGNTSVAPPSGNKTPDRKSGGGGHYYHKYDVTGSLQRKMNKPMDKNRQRVKNDLDKKPLIVPYTVVDVTNCRKECEANQPPQLPTTPPPEHASSCEGSLKKSKLKSSKTGSSSEAGSQESFQSERSPSPRLPIILHDEAKRMRAESRTPPPHRKVPIMIRPQVEGNNNTYEPIEDYLIEDATLDESQTEAENVTDLNPDANSTDYTPTDVSCLSFTRQSKARNSNKSNVFEAKMAALANLDLLKGIAPKVPATDVVTTVTELDESEQPNTSTPINTVEEQGTPKQPKKSGKAFFKKLLKIGSKEGNSSQRENSVDIQDVPDSDVMTRSAHEDSPGSSTQIYQRQGSGSKDGRAMLNEVQNALAKRQGAAPDICRELNASATSNLDQTKPDAGLPGSEVSDVGGSQSTSLTRKKKMMNINVQPISPPDEEKINNIKQAEKMAKSLGIDKMSPRHKPLTPGIGDATASTSEPNTSARSSDQDTATKLPPQGLGSVDGFSASHSKKLPVVQPSRIKDVTDPITVVCTTTDSTQTPKSDDKTETTSVSAVGAATCSPPVRPKPSALSPKPNIPRQIPKKATFSDTSDSMPDKNKSDLPELTIDVEAKDDNLDVYMSKSSQDSITSPTSSESSSLSYVLESEVTSPQPTSPTTDVPIAKRRKSKSRTDLKLGMVSRSMMPAPPPPPPAGCPVSPQKASGPGDVSPDHKPAGKRLRHADISAPILTSPDLMSRSFSIAENQPVGGTSNKNGRRMDSISKHSRNKTVSEGIKIDVNLISPDREDGESMFDSLGRRSGKFQNRALPPTPGQPAHTKGRKPAGSPTSLIQENEYELVSMDGEAEERTGQVQPAERPPYEDIDDDDEVYSDPVEILKGSSMEREDSKGPEVSSGASSSTHRCDDYLEPVPGHGEDDKPAPVTRVLGKRQTLSKSGRPVTDPYLTVYANTDMSVYGGKPARTVKDGFTKMCVRNVETLAARAERILDQFIPEQITPQPDLRWMDFVLETAAPVVQIGDVVFYEARNNKVKPHDCYLMISQKGISRSILERRDCSSVTPVTMFTDKVSSELMTKSTPDHYHMTSPTDTNIAVLSYTSICDLDTAVHNMDCVFSSDLNEYERRVCFWITQITASVLETCTQNPQVQTVNCDSVLAVTLPSCGQTFPILVIPEVLIGQSTAASSQSRSTSQTNWDIIGKDIIRILFKLLRLDYKEKQKDPAADIPIRTKYSVGFRKFVREIMKERSSFHGIVFGKVLIETMLWGPCRDDMRHLMTSDDHEHAFRLWLELKRHLVINDLAMGCCHNTLDFSNMLWFLCSVTAKILMDTTRILQQSK